MHDWKVTATVSTFALVSLFGCRAKGPAETPPLPQLPAAAERFDPTSLVDPFIGTQAHGHTFPGATRPFGMVQLSPDTRLTGWDGCSGYHYDDSVVYGFSHTHLSGTGIADYADILLMPTVLGEGAPAGLGDPEHPFAARFEHADELALPGDYRVKLHEPAVQVELTATPRVGVHRYTFEGAGRPALYLDLRHRDQVIESWVKQVSPTDFVGLRRSKSWARDQRVFFALRLSRPVEGVTAVSGVTPQPGSADGEVSFAGQDIRLLLEPAAGDEPLMAQVALSAVDEQGALGNLNAEAPHWDFDAYRQEAHDSWQRALGTIEVEGGTPQQQRMFYTALYHSMLAPNLWEDVDGRFRGMDAKVHESPDHTAYTVFSLWDTFRATHPLLTLIDPVRTRDFVHSLLSQAQTGGQLPMWELASNYTGTMIGYHAVPVIVDAWAKGITDFDHEQALQASIASADADHLGLPGYRTHGFVPAEQEHESVSKTLEYAYDDWCIAQLAKGVGNDAEYRRFMGRAQYWENIFDPSSGLFRARENGAFVPDFEPREVNIHYTEANAWQYGFFVPHDVGGLVARHGGPKALEERLDRLFVEPTSLVGRQQVDITGLIGQYAHGNEPSHHVAYLYPYVGQAPKTQARVREILDTLYSDAPDGLSGNDDCGQMSSWYVLSALGFYPLAPGRDDYVIGTPLFERATIHLPDGNDFVIEAPGVSSEAFYVQEATLDGKPHDQARLLHGDLTGGGHLVLKMGPEPNPDWGALTPEAPLFEGPQGLLPVPMVHVPEPAFVDSTTIELSLPRGEGEIRYRLDGRPPTADSPRYEGPIALRETTTITAAAFHEGKQSPWVEATVRRRRKGMKVTLAHEPHRSYRAGGPEGLVDGRRGNDRWRTGGWQGYQGMDFEATVDLGKTKPVKRVTVGFLQDARSWIWMPTELRVEVSRDGKRWQSIGKATHDVPDRDTEKTYVRDLVVETKTKRARYIRVRAPSYGQIPDWHLGAGAHAFIFVDEIQVQ